MYRFIPSRQKLTEDNIKTEQLKDAKLATIIHDLQQHKV